MTESEVPPGPDASGPGPFGPAGRAGVPAGTSTSLDPAEAERFAGHLDELERSVAEARDALRRLAETPLATGSGQDARAIGAWYAELLSGDAAPAADDLARELDAVRRAVRAGTAGWEDTEGRAADTFSRTDPGAAGDRGR